MPPCQLALRKEETASTLSDAQQASSTTGPSASVGLLRRPSTSHAEPQQQYECHRDFADGKKSTIRDPLGIEGLVRFTDDVVDSELELRRASSPAASVAAPLPSLEDRQQSPPPQYPASEAASSSPFRSPPPAFSSLYVAEEPDPADILEPYEPYKHAVVGADAAGPERDPPAAAAAGSAASATADAPAYAPLTEPGTAGGGPSGAYQETVAETKRALPHDTKGGERKDDEGEPPPAYSEGSSPLQSFTYLMAAAGGASSIITQVQQGGPPINAIGGMVRSNILREPVFLTKCLLDVGADETISMDLR